jgi:hypothetical protein
VAAIVLLLTAPVWAAVPMSAAEAARALGDLRDGARQNAIASMVRGALIQTPLSGADGAAILLGATHASRAAAIAELVPLFKADLERAGGRGDSRP